LTFTLNSIKISHNIMARDQSFGEPAHTSEALQESFSAYIQDSVLSVVAPLGEEHYDLIEPLVTGLGTKGMVMLYGSERFFSDMERAGRNTTRPPFGLEVTTLSDDLSLVLYPHMIYKPDDEDRKNAAEEDFEVRTEGPQAMLYVMDGFLKSSENRPNTTANLVFACHLIGGLLEGKYPIESDNASPEFNALVKAAVEKVRSFASVLPPEQRSQLEGRIAAVSGLSDGQIDQFVADYIRYQTELIKMPGLREPGNLLMKPDELGERAKDVVIKQREYLRLTDRNLPEITGPADQLPPTPWREFGTNRWNRDHQLFGRYEVPTQDGVLRVDFRLDSTHMPAKYGFFETIEITESVDDQIRQQIVLGQEVDREKEPLMMVAMMTGGEAAEKIMEENQIVFPIIIAGDFDFSKPELRELLDSLAGEKGTKPDVSKPLADTLRFSKEGRLTRLIDPTLN